MICMRFFQRGLAAFLACSLLSAGPIWAEEQQNVTVQSVPLEIGSIGTPAPATPKVDLRAATKAFMLAETGMASPIPAGGFLADHTPVQGGGAAGVKATADKQAVVTSTVPPNAPKTTRNHRIAAFTALAILTAASIALVAREVGHQDPVLTPGAPTRIP
jgi:hypothetical protein